MNCCLPKIETTGWVFRQCLLVRLRKYDVIFLLFRFEQERLPMLNELMTPLDVAIRWKTILCLSPHVNCLFQNFCPPGVVTR